MYCEKCGRKLEEGEICPCKKKSRKKYRFNGKMVISLLLCIGGMLVFKYFYENQSNILNQIPIEFVSSFKGYIENGIVAIIFLIGMVFGILAIKKKSWKWVSWLTMTTNLIGILLICALIGWNGYNHIKIVKLVQGELTDINREKIRNAYSEPTLEESVKAKIINELDDRVKGIEEYFNEEKVSYEEAVKELDTIDDLEILGEEIENVRQNLDDFHASKEAYKEAGELEKNDADLLKAMTLYGQVIERDVNYKQAQKKISEIDEKINKIINSGITPQNKTVFISYYKDGETDRCKQIDEKVLENANKIKEEFSIQQLGYEDANSQLEELKAFSGVSEDVSLIENQIVELKQSKDMYEKAGELEKNDADLLKAMKLYGQVIEEDSNYEEAQKKIEELDKKVKQIIESGVNQESITVLVSYYQESDDDNCSLIDEKVLEYINEIKDEFIDQQLTYEDANNQLDTLKVFSGVYGEVLLTEEYVDKLEQSRDEFKKAGELETNKESVFEAVLCYQRVIKEDPNYETAQNKVKELLNSLAEDCKAEVEELVQGKKYQEALSLIDGCMEISSDNSDLLSLRQDCINQYNKYALKEMERLLEEKKYDEAKLVVSEAYEITSDQELQSKLAEIDSYRPANLTELHVVDGSNYEVQEEVVDSYGDSHRNVMYFNLDNEAYVKYQINGEYSRLSGNLVVTEDTSSNAYCNFAIIADDQIVYSITDYTRQQEAKRIEIDLAGVRELTIRGKDMSNWNYPNLCLTECVLEKAIPSVNTEKKFERLSDNTVIDSSGATYTDGLIQDSYGNLHDCGVDLNAEQNGYILYNLNQKYENFSGNLVVSRGTEAEAKIKVQIYVDDVLVFEQGNIDKTVENIPVSIDVTNGKVLKIASMDEHFYWVTADVYLVDDRLYFESTEEIKAAEAETLVQTKKNDITEGGIHRYEYYLLNSTWEAAYNECLERGGHLVRINSTEEYDYIIRDLNNKHFQDYIFYIGGRRELGTEHYYWAENSNALSGPILDGKDAWCKDYWLEGEPSLEDSTLDVKEHVLMMFYYDDLGKWVWNDVPNNLNEVMPSYKGKLGYICEYDD